MEMTLRLPKNYVEIEEEEMMYLDGGFLNHVNIVAFGINVVFNSLCGGGTISTIKKILSSSSIKNGIKKYIGRWIGTQASNRFAGMIIGALNGFLAFSIGSAVAKLWNRYDTKPWDNYCGWLNI